MDEVLMRPFPADNTSSWPRRAASEGWSCRRRPPLILPPWVMGEAAKQIVLPPSPASLNRGVLSFKLLQCGVDKQCPTIVQMSNPRRLILAHMDLGI